MNESRVMADKGQSAFMVVGTVLWGCYMACGMNHLMEVFVPQHTRNAAFSLFVGLRAENSVKDADFFKIHAESLQPRTYLGWLALGTSLLLASSGTAAACAALLATALTALNTLLFTIIMCGVATGFVLGCTSVMMLVCACVAGVTSLAGASVYVSGATIVKIVHWTHALIVGPASYNQKAQTTTAPSEQLSDSGTSDQNPKATAAAEREAASHQMHTSQGNQEPQSTKLETSEQHSKDLTGETEGMPTTNGRSFGITEEDGPPANASSSAPGQTRSETPSAVSSTSTSSAVKLPFVSEKRGRADFIGFPVESKDHHTGRDIGSSSDSSKKDTWEPAKQDSSFQFATAPLAGQKAVRSPATRRISSQVQPDNSGL